MKTLVGGCYGNVGARIGRAQETGIELIVGGRDLDRATVFAQSPAGVLALWPFA